MLTAAFTHVSEQIGAVESVKAASDIYSPVTGQIKNVNDKLGDEPGLLNKSPEENGKQRGVGCAYVKTALTAVSVLQDGFARSCSPTRPNSRSYWTRKRTRS